MHNFILFLIIIFKKRTNKKCRVAFFVKVVNLSFLICLNL